LLSLEAKEYAVWWTTILSINCIISEYGIEITVKKGDFQA